jgi:hypothetical protein
VVLVQALAEDVDDGVQPGIPGQSLDREPRCRPDGDAGGLSLSPGVVLLEAVTVKVPSSSPAV